jgi:hypothetical protein
MKWVQDFLSGRKAKARMIDSRRHSPIIIGRANPNGDDQFTDDS